MLYARIPTFLMIVGREVTKHEFFYFFFLQEYLVPTKDRHNFLLSPRWRPTVEFPGLCSLKYFIYGAFSIWGLEDLSLLPHPSFYITPQEQLMYLEIPATCMRTSSEFKVVLRQMRPHSLQMQI